MRRFRVAAGIALLCLAGSGQAGADPAKYMKAEPVAESASPKPGSTVLVGFVMSPRPGWHGYWSNPGDSGIAPAVTWTAPEGVTFGPLLHPAPTLLSANGISSFVHDGRHVLLSRMSVAKSVERGTALPVRAELSWAACTETQCVPLHASFTLALVAGDGAKTQDAAELQRAERKLPRKVQGGGFLRHGKLIRLAMPEGLKIGRAARFFPDESDQFRTAAARVETSGGALTLVSTAAGAGTRISGVLSDGSSAYRLSLPLMKRLPTSPQLRPSDHEKAAAPVAQARAGTPASPPQASASPSPAKRRANWLPAATGLLLLLACLALGVARRRRG